MLLVDFNQVMLSYIMYSAKEVEVTEDLVRNIVLNQIRFLAMRFRYTHGDPILCCDSYNYWRKKVFPYYKVLRKEQQKKAKFDFKQAFDLLSVIREEVKQHFPYPVMWIEGTEADDIIATLTFQHPNDNIMIVSRDHDFIQLQTNSNVEQYDPIGKLPISNPRPEDYLKEHVLRGDRGDSIPSVLSEDDCFVVKKRQKAITQVMMKEWLHGDPKEFLDVACYKHYERNLKLIDFREIPKDVQARIMDEYGHQKNKPKQSILAYFMEKGLDNLFADASDF